MNLFGFVPIGNTTMKLLLTSAYDVHPCLDTLREAVACAAPARHSLVASAEEADAILFVENVQYEDLRYRRLSAHPLLQRFGDKCFVYNEADKPWDVLRGLYCSLTPDLFDADRHVPFIYLGMRNPHVGGIDANAERRWLYSFMGAMSHPSRRAVLALGDGEGTGFVRDTSGFDVWHAEAAERERRALVYAEVFSASRFVLCPRGIGTASLRLFEALEAGRAPVIIADDWIAPPHIDWSFALRVNERDIASIPRLLSAHADEAVARGRAARAAWQSVYSREELFDTVGDSLEYLLDGGHARRRRPYYSTLRKWLSSGELAARHMARRVRRAA